MLEALVLQRMAIRALISLPMVPLPIGKNWPTHAPTLPSHGADADADAVEGVMIKRADRPMCRAARRAVVEVEARPDADRRGADVRPARPRQAVQPFYSDYTFGVWKDG
jgi:DNA ligase-1